MYPQNSPSGRRVLLVECNAVIGLHLADVLEDQGYTTAGPFTCAQAMEWLTTHTPDIAVLDVDLQSGSCVEMVRELRRHEVPVIVYSAHEQRFALPEFHDVPWVSIPAPEQALHRALESHHPTHPAALSR